MPEARPADDAAIREQAYYFWEQDGKPDGREGEYWMRALVALSAKSARKTSKAVVKPAKAVEAKPAGKDKAASKLKAAASKAKSAPAKAEAVKKPKKK